MKAFRFRTGTGRAIRSQRYAPALLVALVVLALPAEVVGASVASDSLPSSPPDAVAALEATEGLLGIPTDLPPTLPADPTSALVEAVRSLSAEMGVDRDPTTAVLQAALVPEVAGHIALALSDILACHRLTKAHMLAVAPSVLAAAVKENGNGGGLDPADFQDIRQCAQRLWQSTSHLEEALTRVVPPPGGVDLDVWPVLRYSRSTTDTLYLNDYALAIDAGGDDTYANNAGANLMDVNFGPPGQPGVMGEGPAKGCQTVIPGLGTDCTPAAAVLLDLAGDDIYGVRQSPDVDKVCTADPVVRRMMTNGSGFLGVGILADRSGNDAYSAKTVGNGSGHVYGVGILHDKAGDDRYLDVRNSTGFALVGGLGLLRDHAGDDSHDFYMPSPLDPSAPNQTPGAGGVIDDEGACDNLPRYHVGGGNVGGVGVVLDDGGNDHYRGGFTPDFLAIAGLGSGRGGSLGFGNNGGFGVLLDRAGTDTYEILGNQGLPQRGDGVSILPGTESTGPSGAFRDV